MHTYMDVMFCVLTHRANGLPFSIRANPHSIRLQIWFGNVEHWLVFGVSTRRRRRRSNGLKWHASYQWCNGGGGSMGGKENGTNGGASSRMRVPFVCTILWR